MKNISWNEKILYFVDQNILNINGQTCLINFLLILVVGKNHLAI